VQAGEVWHLVDANGSIGLAGFEHGEVVIVFVSPPRRVASDSNAACKRDGNSLPRFSALRKIPCAALGLKKNLLGTWLSKTSDNEHTSASLGDSEVLRVKHTPRQTITEFIQGFEDDSEIVSVSRRKEAGHVFENKPSRPKLSQDSDNLPEQAALSAAQSCSFSGHRQVLAGESSGNNINCSEFVDSFLTALEDIVITLRIRKSRLQNRDAERLFFHLPDRAKSRLLKTNVKSANPREQTSMRQLGQFHVTHLPPSC
jgi:hypothetical protein